MNRLLKLFFLFNLAFYIPFSFALANPAATNCANQGLTYVIIQNTGICIFSNKTYCEEWSYLRANCDIGKNRFPGGKFNMNNLKMYCIKSDRKNPQVVYCSR